MPVSPQLNSFARRVRQWRELEPWERRLLLRLCFLLPMAWLTLRVFGFNRSLRIVEFKVPPGSSKAERYSVDRGHRCAQLAAIASRHGLYQANCLYQSLALCWILRKEGLPAMLRIGVLPRTQPLQAHAWVEIDGIPLGQSVDRYVAFDSLKTNPKITTFV